MCCVGAQLDELITCSQGSDLSRLFYTSASQDFQDLKINILGPIYMPGATKTTQVWNPGGLTDDCV